MTKNDDWDPFGTQEARRLLKSFIVRKFLIDLLMAEPRRKSS